MTQNQNSSLIKDPIKALDYTLFIVRKVEAETWIIPQSGGKDSRATLWAILCLIADRKLPPPGRLIIYIADTLMEYKSFMDQAIKAIDESADFARKLGIEVHTFTTRPKAQSDYWVRIIGNGLAPPTGNMRWCTDHLKIQPGRDVLKKQGWFGNPVFLGVRYGESKRRDKILSCSVGGECGPDVMVRADKKVPKVQPIVQWAQCAVWDFITLIAPGYGFDPSGLIEHYGPDGDLRYGCWSCPLVWNDKTGIYLSRFNPPLSELVTFTDQHFRSGGAAWKTHNREQFKTEAGISDGRLSLPYCKQLLDWILGWESRHGQMLLEGWQKDMIRAMWEYRKALPPIMAGREGQMLLEMVVEPSSSTPLSLSQVELLTAGNLNGDSYHQTELFFN